MREERRGRIGERAIFGINEYEEKGWLQLSLDVWQIEGSVW